MPSAIVRSCSRRTPTLVQLRSIQSAASLQSVDRVRPHAAPARRAGSHPARHNRCPFRAPGVGNRACRIGPAGSRPRNRGGYGRHLRRARRAPANRRTVALLRTASRDRGRRIATRRNGESDERRVPGDGLARAQDAAQFSARMGAPPRNGETGCQPILESGAGHRARRMGPVTPDRGPARSLQNRRRQTPDLAARCGCAAARRSRDPIAPASGSREGNYPRRFPESGNRAD